MPKFPINTIYLSDTDCHGLEAILFMIFFISSLSGIHDESVRHMTEWL